MHEPFLPLVEKPARYINSEINAVRKDPSQAAVSVCLFFPDTYEVGMSHLGLRILYHVLNRRVDIVCERAFSPWTDYEARLRKSGRPLTSLETNTPLTAFDIIGITLQYELSYTNVLAGLDLAGIPVRSEHRTNDHPAVIAGGPCAVNPGPLSDFVDAFFIGEAEEAVLELADLRKQHPDRREFLRALAGCEGFYVPGAGQTSVRRRRLAAIEAAEYPVKQLVPLMKPVHDRVTVEVARGCIRGCRFCQAGIIYRPYRERSADTITELLECALTSTGYEELSLASLSAGDHSDIGKLVTGLLERHKQGYVSVSLPSLRVGTLTPDMVRAIAGTRKTGFTLAPEAGTERLRRVINKPVSDRDLLDAADTIFRSGWNTIKLYFMIGLPTETDEDLDGIVRIAQDLLAIGKQASRRPIQLNISISTFVPKPHTPFQWFGQNPLMEIRRKQAYLSAKLRRRGITLKAHDPETSVLEGVFARGDRSLGKVLEEAVALGCRFDGWSERFDLSRWSEAFSRSGLDPAVLATKSYGLEEPLPWDHVRIGVTREFLKKEYLRANTGEITGHCREECTHCGIGCQDGGTPAMGKPGHAVPNTAPSAPGTTARGQASPPEATIRIRIEYAKTGRMRYLSHLELMTVLQRALVRAGIPVAYSQGFNPHPRVSFGPALAVGMEGEQEYLDLDADPFADPGSIVERLNGTLPEGIRMRASRVISRKTASLSGSISRYAYEVAAPHALRDHLPDLVSAFLARTTVFVERDGKHKEIRGGIESIVVTEPASDGVLRITLADVGAVKPRIQDVVQQFFGLSREETLLIPVRRVALWCSENGAWTNPLEVRSG